jgi:hypothetical protein
MSVARDHTAFGDAGDRVGDQPNVGLLNRLVEAG